MLEVSRRRRLPKLSVECVFISKPVAREEVLFMPEARENTLVYLEQLNSGT